MDKGKGIGFLTCKVCGQDFQSSINYLSAPVDVYSDWIDACESVAQQALEGGDEPTAEDRNFSTYASERPRATAKAGGADLDDDDDEYWNGKMWDGPASVTILEAWNGIRALFENTK